jgi:hypothetical protein
MQCHENNHHLNRDRYVTNVFGQANVGNTRYTERGWWISPRLGPICDELTASPRLRNAQHEGPSRGIQMLIVMHIDAIMLQYQPIFCVHEAQPRTPKLSQPP